MSLIKKATVKKLVSIREQLEKIEGELYAVGERDVVQIVQAAKRELSQPTLDIAVASLEKDD
jgi:hypothetical protein